MRHPPHHHDHHHPAWSRTRPPDILPGLRPVSSSAQNSQGALLFPISTMSMIIIIAIIMLVMMIMVIMTIMIIIVMFTMITMILMIMVMIITITMMLLWLSQLLWWPWLRCWFLRGPDWLKPTVQWDGFQFSRFGPLLPISDFLSLIIFLFKFCPFLFGCFFRVLYISYLILFV